MPQNDGRENRVSPPAAVPGGRGRERGALVAARRGRPGDNLSEEGRRHAARIGEEFARRRIPLERVLSSPWCRCLETARLAFGKAEASPPLGNLFGRHENRESQVSEMRRMISKPPKNGNLVLVSHGSTILALTGVSPATGEMVIVAADGKVVGRLAP